jgi:predicted metal-binding protein
MADMTSPTRLLICRNCPGKANTTRHKQLGLDAGVRLAERLRSRLHSGDIVVRLVECLSGCLTPCNARLSANGKRWVRLHELVPEDADALAAFARAYDGSPGGDVDPGLISDRLEGKVAASMPVFGSEQANAPRVTEAHRADQRRMTVTR